MMIEPGISELSKCVDSRYTLVTMAAKRARMIGENGIGLVKSECSKPVSVAVKEIVAGNVGYVRHEPGDYYPVKNAQIMESTIIGSVENADEVAESSAQDLNRGNVGDLGIEQANETEDLTDGESY